MSDWVTTDDLLDSAGDAGLEVTRSQLKRLRQHGLLQKPEQVYPSRLLGSETRYPPEASTQLVGVLSVRRHRRSKPFDAVRFLAWEEGLWVEHVLMRRTLVRYLRESQNVTAGLGESVSDDALDERIQKMASDPGPLSPAAKALLGSDPEEQKDRAFNILQLAQGSEDLPLASDRIEEMAGFGAKLEDVGLPRKDLVAVWTDLGVPPLSQWPRIISRISQRLLAAGPRGLTAARAITELGIKLEGWDAYEDDTDASLVRRAFIAAGAIVVARQQTLNTTK